MGRRNLLSFIAASTVALAIAGSASAVVINVTFTPRWNDVNNWPGATPVDRAQNQGRATSDVLQAKSNWETAITDNFNLDVTVDWNLPMQQAIALPNLVARGTVYRGEVDKFAPPLLARLAERGIALQPGEGEDSGVHGVIVRNGRLDGGFDPRREGRVLVETVR